MSENWPSPPQPADFNEGLALNCGFLFGGKSWSPNVVNWQVNCVQILNTVAMFGAGKCLRIAIVIEYCIASVTEFVEFLLAWEWLAA